MCIFVVFCYLKSQYCPKLKNNDSIVRFIFSNIEKQGTNKEVNSLIGKYARIKEDTLASLIEP